MFKRLGILKEFGPKGLKVVEEVAKKPSLTAYGEFFVWKPDIFCLRIDADEYDRNTFKAYYPLFEKYKEALTIFFNASSFKDAGGEILRSRDMGIDIQSHGFYHYTYSDYASNRHNIRKAKEFFLELGIDTIGFTAPFGRYNGSLIRALEDEDYQYSSDFSYDYMAFPSYPRIGGRDSSVLEIPVFPVAPELFFQKEPVDGELVLAYYKEAIDFLMARGIPVIIYAHTHPAMPEIPLFLEKIADYAVKTKNHKPASMTKLFNLWKQKVPHNACEYGKKNILSPAEEGFLGRVFNPTPADALKNVFRDILDFERVTPPEELKCGVVKKNLKLLARRFWREKFL